MKKTLVALAVGCCFGAAMADSYFVVVPSPGRAAAAPPPAQPVLKIEMAPYALPAAKVGQAYEFSLASLVTVTGDAAFDAALVSWSLGGGLPYGLELRPGGIISGTPLAYFEGSFPVIAFYKTVQTEQTYTIPIIP